MQYAYTINNLQIFINDQTHTKTNKLNYHSNLFGIFAEFTVTVCLCSKWIEASINRRTQRKWRQPFLFQWLGTIERALFLLSVHPSLSFYLKEFEGSRLIALVFFIFVQSNDIGTLSALLRKIKKKEFGSVELFWG